jgi:pimeloyl-ACP methyl ester carboxylesterase
MRLYVLIALVWLCGLPVAQASEESVVLAGMDVTVWSHGTNNSRLQPVIIFSHGSQQCPTGSRFLMEAFASAGYLVFAANHRDAICNACEVTWAHGPDLSFQRPETWDENSYRDRAEDIRRLIEAIRVDDRFRSADLSRIGLVGHSLGGYTVLGLGGAWSAWRISDVKAVLALSPYSEPFILRNTLAGLSVPVMYQGGTWESYPAVRKFMVSFDLSPAPKYYVEFEKSDHFAWTDTGQGARKAIIAYSLAFMNHYVKGESADFLLRQLIVFPDVSESRYAPKIDNSDVAKGGWGYLF